MSAKSSTESPNQPASRCDVVAGDLALLDVLHRLLALLNDPRASAGPIAALVGQLPVLEARVRRGCRCRAAGSLAVGALLTMLGNRSFEAILLELLEDLTILRSTLEE